MSGIWTVISTSPGGLELVLSLSLKGLGVLLMVLLLLALCLWGFSLNWAWCAVEALMFLLRPSVLFVLPL